MKRLTKLSFCLFLVTQLFFAQEIDWTQKIPFDSSIKVGKLENGLTYYIKKNNKPENKAILRLIVNAGSILEDDDQQGLAHFMEHMNFNGTKRFPKNKLVDYLETIGVKFGQHLNAYTSFDETVYFLPIPTEKPENIETGLNILEDWAFNANLTHEEIDKERGVVLEEYRLGLGSGKRMMEKYLPKLLYKSQYVDRLPIGKKEILENFKYESLERFYKDWYRPNLMSIIVVGDVNEEEIEKMIISKFSNYKNPEIQRPRKTFEIPNHRETLVSIESDKETTSSSVSIYYKDIEATKPISNLEDYKQYTIERIFGSILSERFEDLVRSPTPPFLYGSSIYDGIVIKNKKAFQSMASTEEGKQLSALKVLLTENERVKKFGFTENELIRAKKSWLSHFERHYNERDKKYSKGIVDLIQSHVLTQEILPTIEWKYEIIQQILPQITLEEVNNLMKNYIKDDNRVIILTSPEKEGLQKVTEQEVLESLKINPDEITPYDEKIIAKSLLRNEPSAGTIIKRKENKKLGIKTLYLSNGAKVIYKKTDFKNDEILFSAVSFGGSDLYSNEEYKKTQHANSILNEAGFSGLSTTDISKFMSEKRAGTSPYIGQSSEGFSGSASPKDLEYLFQMTYAYFTDLNFDQAIFDAQINKMQAMYKNILSNPNAVFGKEINDYLNKKNPRYNGVFPTEQSLKNTDYALSFQKYKERFANAADFEFFFVGNIDDEKLEDYCCKYIASLPANDSREEQVDLGYRMKITETKKIVNKGKEPKSMVMILFHDELKFNKKEANSFSILGEVLKIKLTEKLREIESGVYGVSSFGSMSKKPHGSYTFSISFPCGPENVDKLTASALNELQKIITQGPEEKDLNKVIDARILELKNSKKENSYWLSKLSSTYSSKESIESLLKESDDFKNIKIKDLQNVAQKYLTKEKFIGVLMPESN